jgi:hypothetical protein
VPGVLNVHEPTQPGGLGSNGSGGTGPLLSPAVCTHDDGCDALKSTLWKLPPAGYENVTFPPAVIVTVEPPPAGLLYPRSNASIAPSTSGALEGAEASP